MNFRYKRTVIFVLLVMSIPCSATPAYIDKTIHFLKKVRDAVVKSFVRQERELKTFSSIDYFPYHIRLLSDDVSDAWLLSADDGFVLTDGTIRKVLATTRTIMLRKHNGKIFMNGKRIMAQQILIQPIEGILTVDTVPVEGVSIMLEKDDVRVTVFTQQVRNKTYVAYDGAMLEAYSIMGDQPSSAQQIAYDGRYEPLFVVARLPQGPTDVAIGYQEQLTALAEYMTCVQTDQIVEEKPQPFNVRVLLHESADAHGRSWQFRSEHGFIVYDSARPDRKKVYTDNLLTVCNNRGVLKIKNKHVSRTHVVIAPKEGTVSFGGKSYDGVFWMMRSEGRMMLINSLPLEEYVCSVLRTESWPGWPLEVNKAFAITSRTYVIATALNARKTKRLYHVKNTNEHQTYSGTHNSTIIKDAVVQTKGIFLAHDNKPIMAMFDSCCGGVIPAHITDVNFSAAPYLARKYPCKHCKRCKIFSWQVSYELHELEHFLQEHLPTQRWLRKVAVTKADKAGVVQEVVLKGVTDSILLHGKKMYSLLKEIKSFCFAISHEDDKVVFDGRGFGHHLGLCQWGAREMVRDGWGHKKILQFYYPGTNFMRLS